MKNVFALSRYLGLLWALSLATNSFAERADAHSFKLPDHGSIQVRVPKSWQADVRQPPSHLPPTIRFMPTTGAPFEVLMTPIWSAKKDGSLSRADALRRQIEQAAERLKAKALEERPLIKELHGLAGLGYYFSLTDRAPTSGEYKYLTQGIIRVGNLDVTFTILTNDDQKKVVSDTLMMLKKAVHKSDEAI